MNILMNKYLAELSVLLFITKALHGVDVLRNDFLEFSHCCSLIRCIGLILIENETSHEKCTLSAIYNRHGETLLLKTPLIAKGIY